MSGFFSREAGQRRRRWLRENIDDPLSDTLGYYLGPQLAPQVEAMAELLPELTGAADYRDAVRGADTMFTGDWANRVSGAGQMTSAIAAALVPGVSARMTEGATDAMGDIAKYLADETGAIRAWHGSPHDFDEFSMDKIGTGEGAQVYGHGLYFAEHPDTANTYRNAVSGRRGSYGLVGEDPVDYKRPDHLAAAWEHALGSRSAAADYLDGRVRNWRVQRANVGSEYEEAIRLLRSNAAIPEFTPPGRLYEVDIHADPADFLDWDKPLSEQGAFDKIKADWDANLGDHEIIIDRLGIDPNTATGQAYINKLVPNQGEAWRGLSLKLNEQGVPGIKYLDQGSRAAGDGTRNYVVFDASIVEIVKKYGLAAAAPLLGMTAADVEAFKREYKTE